MLSVSEQIQNYRAIKAQSNTVPASIASMTTNPIVLHRHPKTKEFFNSLMQRWNQDYLRTLLPRQTGRTSGSSL